MTESLTDRSSGIFRGYRVIVVRPVASVGRWLPGLAVVRTYQRSFLRGDISAGLTVTAYLVPQVMAYATLAGLPPQSGLWVVIATLVVYFVLGSSRVLSAGPESTTALLTAATLAPLAAADAARYASLAVILALLCGAIGLLCWVLRMGFIGDLLSKPVLIGYMAGVAVIMITSQLGKVTGIDVSGDSFIADISSFARGVRIQSPDWPTVAMGASVALALILLTPRFRRAPVALVIIALATFVTFAFELQRWGIKTVEAISLQPPSIGFDSLAGDDIRLLLLPALGLFIVAYSDNILTARMFAERYRGRVDANSELLALGATNIASAAAHGFPVSSSASRTALGEASGARTQVYSLVAALGTLIVLLAFSGVLSAIPLAALGGLVVYAATTLVDFPGFRRLWAFRRREFFLAVAAAVGVLAFDILYGILAAVALSVIELLTRVARPHAAILGQGDGVPGWHDIEDLSTPTQIPGLLVFRYDSPLFFANADDFVRRCEGALDSQPSPPQWLLLNMEANVEVDITGLDALERLRRHCERAGVVLALVRVKHAIVVELDRHGVGGRIGHEHIYPTLPTAVDAYLNDHGKTRPD